MRQVDVAEIMFAGSTNDEIGSGHGVAIKRRPEPPGEKESFNPEL